MPEAAAIRALLGHLPGPDLEAGAAAAVRGRQLTKPSGPRSRAKFQCITNKEMDCNEQRH
jgi:hypothetical protein